MCHEGPRATEVVASGGANGSGFRIILADDHRLVRDALRPALCELAENVEIAECASFTGLMELAKWKNEPSLAIVELHLPGMSGLEEIDGFRSLAPKTPVVILSGYHDHRDVLAAFKFGVAGFISKTASVESTIIALRLILSGQRFFPSEVLESVGISLAQSAEGHPGGPNFPYSLTVRESEVLDQLVEGNSNKAIARSIGVQEVTVKLHVRKLLRKFDARNRTEAVKIALQSGWCSEP